MGSSTGDGRSMVKRSPRHFRTWPGIPLPSIGWPCSPFFHHIATIASSLVVPSSSYSSTPPFLSVVTILPVWNRARQVDMEVFPRALSPSRPFLLQHSQQDGRALHYLTLGPSSKPSGSLGKRTPHWLLKPRAPRPDWNFSLLLVLTVIHIRQQQPQHQHQHHHHHHHQQQQQQRQQQHHPPPQHPPPQHPRRPNHGRV